MISSSQAGRRCMVFSGPSGGVTLLTLALALVGGCFSSEPLAGSPCDEETMCGKELTCIAGYCKPASCDGDPSCAPYATPCLGESEANDHKCTEVGARGCFYPERAPSRGYCALLCDVDLQCPPGPDGATATPTCVEAPLDAGSVSTLLCALDCDESRICPPQMSCSTVQVGATSRQICFFSK
jgi:hypothetical protein